MLAYVWRRARNQKTGAADIPPNRTMWMGRSQRQRPPKFIIQRSKPCCRRRSAALAQNIAESAAMAERESA